MRHIIPISGKDSLATALVQIAREPDLPYELFFNDVRAELPETYEWLNKVEEKLGKKIHRIGKSLEYIIYEKGFLPAPKVRFCTCLSKIKPMEEWVGEDATTAYFGIRADEDRVGYSSSSHTITPKFPLQELGIGLPEVYRIVDSQGLRPPTFLWQRMVDIVSEKLDARSRTGFRLFRNAKDTFARIPPHIFDRLFCWRSRPNCFFCLFQSKWEWVGLLEHHPELFDKAEKIETDVGGKDRREGRDLGGGQGTRRVQGSQADHSDPRDGVDRGRCRRIQGEAGAEGCSRSQESREGFRSDSMKETRKEMLARLRKVEAEYQKVRMGIESEPEGNGFATQEEMRKAASELYGSTNFSLRRKLGIV